MGAEQDRSQQTYEEAEQARPPEDRPRGFKRYEIPDELVQQAMEILERDFPGTIASMKEIMRDGGEHRHEYAEQAERNSRAMLVTFSNFRFIIEHDDPYWARADLINRVQKTLQTQIAAEDEAHSNLFK